MAAAPSPQFLATGGLDGVLRLWSSGKELASYKFDSPVRAVEIAPETIQAQEMLHSADYDEPAEFRIIAVVGKFVHVCHFDPYGEVSLRGSFEHGDLVFCAIFDSLGEYIISASADQTTRVWQCPSRPGDDTTNKPIFALLPEGVDDGSRAGVSGCCISDDGARVVTSNFDTCLRCFSLNWQNNVITACHSTGMTGTCFYGVAWATSEQDQVVAVGFEDISLWQVNRSGELLSCTWRSFGSLFMFDRPHYPECVKKIDVRTGTMVSSPSGQGNKVSILNTGKLDRVPTVVEHNLGKPWGHEELGTSYIFGISLNHTGTALAVAAASLDKSGKRLAGSVIIWTDLELYPAESCRLNQADVLCVAFEQAPALKRRSYCSYCSTVATPDSP